MNRDNYDDEKVIVNDNVMFEVVVHHNFLVEPNLNQLVNHQQLFHQVLFNARSTSARCRKLINAKQGGFEATQTSFNGP